MKKVHIGCYKSQQAEEACEIKAVVKMEPGYFSSIHVKRKAGYIIIITNSNSIINNNAARLKFQCQFGSFSQSFYDLVIKFFKHFLYKWMYFGVKRNPDFCSGNGKKEFFKKIFSDYFCLNSRIFRDFLLILIYDIFVFFHNL